MFYSAFFMSSFLAAEFRVCCNWVIFEMTFASSYALKSAVIKVNYYECSVIQLFKSLIAVTWSSVIPLLSGTLSTPEKTRFASIRSLILPN